MRDGTSLSADPLKSLINDSTVAKYGECWGRLLVFVVRLRRLERQGTPFHNIHLTPTQQKWADNAIDYCEQRPGHPRIRRICLELSRHLWSDPKTGFQHMVNNCFSDTTTLFLLLINIGHDGAFANPEDVTNHLAPIKYTMHLEMLCWAAKYTKDNQKTMTWTEDTCAKELDKTRTGPFQVLCDTCTMAYNCASASSKLPDVVWQGEDDDLTVTVSG
ncbi:hypothetical protein FRC08_002196 [Ceratobasidium sp. 394]|nr:hypothetical protein FRC08_002196 [Ceratobasidium sp. 394]